MKPTGFTPEQKAGILMREGDLCAMFGANPRCRQKATTVNHRLNRGMGGSRYRNATDNGCAICDVCNDDIETNPRLAAVARARGVKLREGDNPRTTPFWCVFYGQWTQLVDGAMLLLGLTDLAAPPVLTDPDELDL